LVSAFVVFCAVAAGLEPVAADPPPDPEPPVVPDWYGKLAAGDPADDVTSPPVEPAVSAPPIESTPLDTGVQAAELPRAGVADVTLADRGTARRAGESPIRLSAGSSASVGTAVRVEVLDQVAAERAGVHGFAFRLGATPGAARTAGTKRPVTLSVDYAAFADLYGADYGGRLRVVALPACAVADPVPPECDRAGTPLVTRNDRADKRLLVDVPDLATVADVTVAAAPAAPEPTSTSTSTSSTTAPTTTSTTAAESEDAPRETTIVTEPTAAVRPVAAAAPAQAGPGVVLAVAPGPESEGGSFKATPFEMSGDWQVGVGSGDFSWTYDFPVLDAPAGETPDVSLSYSSAAVDSMVTSKNTQPGNVGLGWGDFANAFIERRYNGCSNEGTQLGDLCWAKQNASISLNGHSSELVAVPPAQGQPQTYRNWVVKDDPRWVIERLTVADYPQIDNGDNDGEHWRVTTPDGTQYWFGIAKDPEQLETPFTTASTWTVPVVGDDTGEPCNGLAYNLCTQAWRWNLDRIVDPNGNERWYQYTAEVNHYQAVGGQGGHGADAYIRSGYLKRIWFGTYLDEDAYSASVIFDINYRCNTLDAPGTPTCVHPSQAPPGMTYPDVPLDMQCDGGVCPQTSPTFFSKERYTGVHVCVRGRFLSSVCEDVDYFKFSHVFSSTAEGTDDDKLFLTGIQRTGHDLGPTDSPLDDPTLTLPATTFSPVALQNRVQPAAGESPMRHWRIGKVTDEFGREVNVTYGQPHPCPAVLPTFWDNNTKDCFPQFWAPAGQSPTLRAFNKWLVTQVEVKALNGNTPSGASPPMVTKYFYGNQINSAPAAPQSWNASRDQAEGAWHHDDDPFTAQGLQSWSDWRGYQDVLVVQGQSRTRYKVYRGMDGDLFLEPFPGGSRTVNISSLDGTVVSTPDSNWFAGRILDQASLRPDGSEETGTVHGYQAIVVADAQPSTNPIDDARWVGENDTVTRLRTPAAGTVYRRQRTQTIYNGFFKFPEYSVEHGWTDATGDERCTRTEYAISLTPIVMLDYPQRVTRYDNGTACSGTAVTRAETAYDNGAVGAAPVKGNPTTSRVQISSAPSPNGTWAVTTTTYDRFGRPLVVTDPNGHPTTTQRGTNNNDLGYPAFVKVTNASGHQTQTNIAYGRQLPASASDANGKTTNYAYDALGRASKVWQPTEPTSGPASWEFSYDIDAERDEVPVIRTRQLQDLAGSGGSARYLDTWMLFDSLLRERQAQAVSPVSGKVIVKDMSYDAQGRVAIANVPEAVTGTPGNLLLAVPTDGWRNTTQTVYDHMSRPVWEIFFADDTDADALANNAQRSSTTTYTHETVEVDPLVGGNTRTKTDGLGRNVEVSEHDGTAFQPTIYTYNKADQLLTVKDPANNTIAYTYDMAGRRTTMDDPDAGDWSYGYDPAGNQTSVTDALLAAVYTNYDTLNRPIERRKDSPTAAGPLLATWAYDAPGELGLLNSSTRVTASGNWVVDVTGYDARNRPSGRSWDIPSGLTGLSGLAGSPEFAVTYGYDKADHPTTVGYPAVGGLAAETVTTTYDGFGLRDTMNGASPYVTFSWFDERSRPALFGFGPSTNYSMSKLWQYDLNQQLKVQQATATGGGLVQDRSIAYDKAGNVTERNTTLSGASFRECFGYDLRQRLTSAYTTTPATTCASGTNKGIGANPYNHTYKYSVDGNLQERKEGATTIAYGYPAGGPSSTRPHAPTTVGSNGYTWNANGNQATRTIGSQTQTLTWDAEHRLSTLNGPAGNNTFTYDAEGARLLRQTPVGTTLYIDGHEITVPAGQSTATAVRSYGFGGQPAATRTPAGLDYLVTDNQGSVEETIPAGNTTTEFTRTYYPYGKLRTGGQPDTDHTWIGQIEDDTTSLQYLNARYYDVSTGTFASVDPIYDTTRSQTLNPINYGMNSPATQSDPSGLDPPCFHPGASCSPAQTADQVATAYVAGGGAADDYQAIYEQELVLAAENNAKRTADSFVAAFQGANTANDAVDVVSKTCDELDCGTLLKVLKEGGPAGDVAAAIAKCATANSDSDCKGAVNDVLIAAGEMLPYIGPLVVIIELEVQLFGLSTDQLRDMVEEFISGWDSPWAGNQPGIDEGTSEVYGPGVWVNQTGGTGQPWMDGNGNVVTPHDPGQGPSCPLRPPRGVDPMPGCPRA
jgi:RHS repeat-associated protein